MNQKLTHSISTLFIGILLWMCQSCSQSPYQVDALPYQTSSQNGWGFVTTEGQVVLPEGTFSRQPSTAINGIFSLPDKDGYYRLYRLNNPGQPMCSQRFYRVGHYFEEATLAQEFPDSPILVLNRNGQIINDIGMSLHYDIVWAHNYNEGMALFCTRKGKFGFLNLHGKIALPPLYDQAFDFHEGKALVGTLNEQGEMAYALIDHQGKVCTNLQMTPVVLDTQLSDGRLKYTHRTSGQCCYLNEEGATEIFLGDSIREAFRFEKRMALVQTETGMGVINTQGLLLQSSSCQEGFVAGEDRIAWFDGQHWYLSDEQGNRLPNTQSFLHITRFYPAGQALATLKEGMMWIDRNGTPVHTTAYFHIAHDSTALKEYPQLFVRKSKQIVQPEKNKSAGNKENNVPAMAANHALPQQVSPKVKPQSVSEPGCVLNGEEWKKISQQSPFYKEACKITSGKLAETDMENRRMILNYVEHLRTSYTTKDIDFLTQLFSEEALIIVGKVVRKAPQIEGEYLPREQIQYNVKSKQAYLGRLKVLFKQNKEIKLRFSDFKIMRHPTTPGLYGVSLRQRYQSDLYSDDGYLFLLWDFRDENQPLIHVRTWQPRMLDNQTPLAEEDIFNIRNFNLQ